MGAYTKLLRTPGVARVMGSQLLARFPYGLIAITFALHFVSVYKSYAVAGLAIGAQTIGVGVTSPWLGRKLAVWNMRRTLIWCSVGFAVGLLVLTFVTLPAWLAIAVAGACGVVAPPVQTASRATFDQLVKADQLPTIFSFDSISQELIWIIGPVVAAGLSSAVSPQASMLLMVATGLGGTLWFVSNHEVKNVHLEEPQHKLGGVLRSRAVVSLVAVGTLLVAGFAGVEIGTIGTIDKATAGIVLAVLSIGSMVGGVLLGHRARRRGALAKYSVLIFVGYALSLIAPTSALWLSVCWFIAGIGVAPALGLIGLLINQVTSKTAALEANGWLGTGQLIGYSAAASMSGFAIDRINSTAPCWIASVVGLLTVVVAILAVPTLPKLITKND